MELASHPYPSGGDRQWFCSNDIGKIYEMKKENRRLMTYEMHNLFQGQHSIRYIYCL